MYDPDNLDHNAARFAVRYPIAVDVRLIDPQGETRPAVAIDISASGLGLDALLHFPPGTPLTVELPTGESFPCKTVWRDGFHSGLQFDTTLRLLHLDAVRSALAGVHRPQRNGESGTP